MDFPLLSVARDCMAGKLGQTWFADTCMQQHCYTAVATSPNVVDD
jgi:hypothetical protein